MRWATAVPFGCKSVIATEGADHLVPTDCGLLPRQARAGGNPALGAGDAGQRHDSVTSFHRFSRPARDATGVFRFSDGVRVLGRLLSATKKPPETRRLF
jgi:hypothetical protein